MQNTYSRKQKKIMELKILIIGLLFLGFICFIAFLLDLLLSKIFSEIFQKLENWVRKKI